MIQFIKRGTEQEEVGRTAQEEQLEGLRHWEPLTSLRSSGRAQCCRWGSLGVDSEEIGLQDTRYEVPSQSTPTGGRKEVELGRERR